MGEWRYSSTHFKLRSYMNVSGQLHAPGNTDQIEYDYEIESGVSSRYRAIRTFSGRNPWVGDQPVARPVPAQYLCTVAYSKPRF